jgi:hypothetical protein
VHAQMDRDNYSEARDAWEEKYNNIKKELIK